MRCFRSRHPLRNVIASSLRIGNHHDRVAAQGSASHAGHPLPSQRMVLVMDRDLVTPNVGFVWLSSVCPTVGISPAASSGSAPAAPLAVGRCSPSALAPVPPAIRSRLAPGCARTSLRPPRSFRRSGEPPARPRPARPRATLCRSACRTGLPGLPSLSHAMPSGVSERSLDLVGSCQYPPVLSPFLHPSRPRPLPSAGVTRPRRYYGPLRHPARPSLPLAGCRLARARHRQGFPCCLPSPSRTHAVANTPAEPPGALVARFPDAGSLPRFNGGSASASSFSRPARRFTRVPACVLAEPPMAALCHRSASVLFVTSSNRSDCLPAGATVAGRDSNPLGVGALSRRTLNPRLVRGIVRFLDQIVPLRIGWESGIVRER